MKLPQGFSVVPFHFMVVTEQLYDRVETPSTAKHFVPAISLCRAKPACNNCFRALHPFSLMGAFAGRLKANGLIEQAFCRCVHSVAIYRTFAELQMKSICPIKLQICQSWSMIMEEQVSW